MESFQQRPGSPHRCLAYGALGPSLDHDIFVGRQRELDILGRRMNDALVGRGGLVMLVGEAGIGKTWVAGKFAEEARRPGVTVLHGCCFEGEWQPPYAPWGAALGGYARVTDPERLRRQLGRGAGPLVRIMPEIGDALPDVPVAAPLNPSEERFRLYDAVTHFLLNAAADDPLLVVLDDLQWADRESLGLLRHLARSLRGARLLVIGIYREPEPGLGPQHPLMDALGLLRREVDYEHVIVRGLSREEVAEYLASVGGQPPSRPLIEAIYDETGGNPFYVSEVFRHLLEGGRIQRRGGQWLADFSPGDLGIPEGVRQVVIRRVSRLSSDTNEMLALAAGFTGGFEVSVIQAITELPEHRLLDCIDEALSAGLIRAIQLNPPLYAFAHAIVRRTLYDRLNPDRRTRLHRRIALALERVYAGREMDRAAELAEQYHASASLAGAEKGLRYALAAAERAKASYAYQQAVEFLRMARDFSVEDEPRIRADVLCKLAIAEAEALLLEDARQSVQDALASLAEAGTGPRAQASFLVRAVRTLKDGGASPAVWEPLLNRGLSPLGQERDLLWARLTLLRDRFEVVHKGAVNVINWLGPDPQAMAIARLCGDEDDYAQTLDTLDWRSVEETEAVLTLSRRWTRPMAVMRALNVVGRDLLKNQGALRDAADLYQELLNKSERYGAIAGQGEALLQLAIIHTSLGELSRAQETMKRARDVIERLGPGHQLQFGELALRCLLAYFLDGDWPTLAKATIQFVGSPEAARNPRALVAAGYAALSCARLGGIERLRQILSVVTPLIAPMDPRVYLHHGVIAFGGSAVWESGATEFAEAYRQMALGLIAAGFGGGVLIPELTAGRMAALAGDIESAEEQFALARVKLEAAAMRPARAIVDHDEALALVRNGSPDLGHILDLLDGAEKAFRALGMRGWVKRVMAIRKKATASEQSGRRVYPLFPDGLSRRETEVLRLLASGKTSREIAAILMLSTRTVEGHIANIYEKTGARGRVNATAYALRHHLIEAQTS